MISRRNIFVLLATTALTACVSGPGSLDSYPYKWKLKARVKSSAEVYEMFGDVLITATSYRIEPVDTPGKSFIVIGERSDWPVAGDRIYDFVIQRQLRHYVLYGHTDPSLYSDLRIVSCDLSDSKDATPAAS